MSQAAYPLARGWAAHWCQRWFLDSEGEDRLRLECGVSAGWATHIEAYLLLLDVDRRVINIWQADLAEHHSSRGPLAYSAAELGGIPPLLPSVASARTTCLKAT